MGWLLACSGISPHPCQHGSADSFLFVFRLFVVIACFLVIHGRMAFDDCMFVDDCIGVLMFASLFDGYI